MTYQIKSKLATLFQPCLGCLKPPEAAEGRKEGSLAERNLVADCVERGGDVCDNEEGVGLQFLTIYRTSGLPVKTIGKNYLPVTLGKI